VRSSVIPVTGPTLDELAHAAVFLASERATAFTGAIVNLTAGKSPD
jgi:hypothetical protein